MARHRRPPSQGWKTFLRNHADGIASMDLRRSDTLISAALWLADSQARPTPNVMVGRDGASDGRVDARQLTEACGWSRCQGTSSAIATVSMAKYSNGGFAPWAFVIGPPRHDRHGRSHTERLIGSIRRKCLDHVVVFGKRHLRHLLLSYMAYYNGARTHLSLTRMRRSHGLFRQSDAFFRLQFSADYTITMFGFDFRQGQAMVNGNLRQRLRYNLHLPTLPLHPIFQPTPPLLRAA